MSAGESEKQEWHLPRLMYVKSVDYWSNGNNGLKGLAADALIIFVIINVAIAASMVDPPGVWLCQIRDLGMRMPRNNETHRKYWIDKYPDMQHDSELRKAFVAEMMQISKALFRTLYLIEALLLEFEHNDGKESVRGPKQNQISWHQLFLDVLKFSYNLKATNSEDIFWKHVY